MWLLIVTLVLFTPVQWVLRVYACQRHIDCIDRNSLCFAAQCIRAKRLPLGRTCNADGDCKTHDDDPRQKGRGCKFGKCHEIRSVPRSGSCNYQEECPGQSICVQYHCVPAEPTEHKCHRQAQCGIGERCLGGMCFRPMSKPGRRQRRPLGYDESSGFDRMPIEQPYPPVYPEYDEMDLYSQEDYFSPTFMSYLPPPVPQCSSVQICPALCCSVPTCAEAACCCQATYFSGY